MGTYPHRTGPATCCKDEGLKCWDFIDGEDWTSAAFDVGGGKGDHDSSTPAHPHWPIQKLTGAKRLQRSVNTTALKDLEPTEHMHDHNLCEDNEEENGGLCYKTCDELTDGQYPFRTSAFSCCKSKPCNILN